MQQQHTEYENVEMRTAQDARTARQGMQMEIRFAIFKEARRCRSPKLSNGLEASHCKTLILRKLTPAKLKPP
jgi:hypothetical protein